MPGCHMHSLCDNVKNANITCKIRPSLPFSFIHQARERKMRITEEDDRLQEEEEESEPLQSYANYGMYKSCGSIDRLSYILKDKPIESKTMVKSQSVVSLHDAEMAFEKKDRRNNLHSLELGGMKNNPNTAWIFAVPSKITKHKECDEVSEDFRKAGIGTCLRGERFRNG
jgi:hypothetical protein